MSRLIGQGFCGTLWAASADYGGNTVKREDGRPLEREFRAHSDP